MSQPQKVQVSVPRVCSESSQSFLLYGMCKASLKIQFIKFSEPSQRRKSIVKSTHYTWWEKKSCSNTHFTQMCPSGLNLPSKLSLTSPWRGERKLRSLGCRSWVKITPALRSCSPKMPQRSLCFTSKHSDNVWAPDVFFQTGNKQGECVQERHRRTYCWQKTLSQPRVWTLEHLNPFRTVLKHFLILLQFSRAYHPIRP